MQQVAAMPLLASRGAGLEKFHDSKKRLGHFYVFILVPQLKIINK
jgi:hypothetical protein